METKKRIPWNKGLKGVQTAWNKGVTVFSGENHPMYGKKHTKETKEKQSLAKLGKPSLRKGKKYGSPSEETRLKLLGRVPWNKGKKFTQVSGENHWNWKGDTANLNKRVRGSFEYTLWRTAVFERDNYTCIWCGIKGSDKGGYLNADHIKPFALYPELRFAIDNGRTLCVPCHKTTDTYKGRTNKNNIKLP